MPPCSRSARGSVEQPGRHIRQTSGLNRSILDQGWYEFRRQLDYKLAWRGAHLVVVPPHNTSRTCPECGHVAAENRRTQARFSCVECGYKAHADYVGAINVLQQEPTEAAQERLNAAPERRRNPLPFRHGRQCPEDVEGGEDVKQRRAVQDSVFRPMLSSTIDPMRSIMPIHSLFHTKPAGTAASTSRLKTLCTGLATAFALAVSSPLLAQSGSDSVIGDGGSNERTLLLAQGASLPGGAIALPGGATAGGNVIGGGGAGVIGGGGAGVIGGGSSAGLMAASITSTTVVTMTATTAVIGIAATASSSDSGTGTGTGTTTGTVN